MSFRNSAENEDGHPHGDNQFEKILGTYHIVWQHWGLEAGKATLTSPIEVYEKPLHEEYLRNPTFEMGGQPGKLVLPPESYILTIRGAPPMAEGELGGTEDTRAIDGSHANKSPVPLEGRFEAGCWYASFKCNHRDGQLHDFEWTKRNACGVHHFGLGVKDDNGNPFVKVIVDSGCEHGTDTELTFYANSR